MFRKRNEQKRNFNATEGAKANAGATELDLDDLAEVSGGRGFSSGEGKGFICDRCRRKQYTGERNDKLPSGWIWRPATDEVRDAAQWPQCYCPNCAPDPYAPLPPPEKVNWPKVKKPNFNDIFNDLNNNNNNRC